ncbi:MAG: hypothetical protein K9G11_00505 [Rickettsiaceae bacterium]|nr:hypothetical protein [Rickettsiaceae bacterium]
MRAQPLVEYVWKESVALDCHALQARNDATTLPLEDVASLCIRMAKMPISHRFVSSRAVSLRTSVVIQLLTSFKNYIEKSFVLDCHGANASRNDASALPLGDVASLCIMPVSYRLVSSRAASEAMRAW